MHASYSPEDGAFTVEEVAGDVDDDRELSHLLEVLACGDRAVIACAACHEHKAARSTNCAVWSELE